MADLAIGAIGAAVAGIPGAGLTALQGFAIGNSVGQLLFPASGPAVENGRLSEIRVGGASHGTGIPQVFNRMRVPGVVLWASELEEVSETRRVGGKGGQSVTDLSYFADLAIMICKGPIERVRRIWANADLIYDATGSGDPDVAAFLSLDDLTIYLGTSSQNADPLMQAALGAGDVPAYRGRAYVVFENFPLTRYGNGIPQFSFEVETAPFDLEQILLELFQEVGVDAADCDFSALVGIVVTGMVVSSRQPLHEVLDWLQNAFSFDIIEDGLLRAVPRPGKTPIVIPIEDLCDAGEEQPFEIGRGQEVEIPDVLEVAYHTAALDYQQNVQSAHREIGRSDEVQTLQWPLVLSEDSAKRQAITVLEERMLARQPWRLRLMPRWKVLAPGDVIEVPGPLGPVELTIQAMTIADDETIEVAAIPYDAEIYTQEAKGATPFGSGTPGGIEPDYPTLTRFASHVHALTDVDVDLPVAYALASSRRSAWSGVRFEMTNPSLNFGVLWDTQPFTVTAKAVTGTLVDAMPEGTPWILDQTYSVTVQMDFGQLQSITKQQLLDGGNMAIIGDELFQYQSAELVGEGQYELSGFIRGRRGSEYAMSGGHTAGKRFFLLDARRRVPYEYVGVGPAFPITKNVRATALGTQQTPQESQAFHYASTMRPYAPVQLKVEEIGGGSRKISWVRRAPKFGDLQNSSDIPLIYSLERYALIIVDAATERENQLPFWWPSPAVNLGASAGEYPNWSTALTEPEFTLTSGEWDALPNNKRIAVCQLGIYGTVAQPTFQSVGVDAQITGTDFNPEPEEDPIDPTPPP